MLNNCTLAKQTSGFLLLYVSGPKKHGVQQSISDFGKSVPDWARGIGQQGFPGSISQMNLPTTDPFWTMEVYLPMDCLPYKINYSCNIYNRPMDPMITTTQTEVFANPNQRNTHHFPIPQTPFHRIHGNCVCFSSFLGPCWQASRIQTTSWWLNHPFANICASQIGSSPRVRVKIEIIWNNHLENWYISSIYTLENEQLELKNHPIKEKNIFQTSIVGFHVNFAGCNAYIPGMLADSKLLIPKLMVGTLDFMIRNFVSCISWYIYIYTYIYMYTYMYTYITYILSIPHLPTTTHPFSHPPVCFKIRVSLAELKILCPGWVLRTLSSHSWCVQREIRLPRPPTIAIVTNRCFHK